MIMKSYLLFFYAILKLFRKLIRLIDIERKGDEILGRNEKKSGAKVLI